MLIVDSDVLLVERQLWKGGLGCPSCSSPLAPWGHGRSRVIRGERGARLLLRPRRTRCSRCRITQVLLPAVVQPRRADAVVVIGAGLEMAACGLGHHPIAAHLGRPEGTVRGWLRRFNSSAQQVHTYFTAVPVSVADDPVVPEPAGYSLVAAVRVVLAAVNAVRDRFDLVVRSP